MKPLVSVICVCFNHARFVVEALESVRNQTYPNIEFIIVDDGSSDGSPRVIEQWLKKNINAVFLNLKENAGYTKAFNKAFALAKGDFFIDLSGDDVLLPERIQKGIDGFIQKGERYAIQFSDANLIDANGKFIGKHSDKFPHTSVPQGDLYAAVIQRYFVCSPTMVVRKSVVDGLGGYDESLVYEDFDLWVRVSRDHHFFYLLEPLVNVRVLPGSLGDTQYTRNSPQLESTFRVCEKILNLNRTPVEKRALTRRVLYELKQNIKLFHVVLCARYIGLLIQNWKKKL
jgi:glycosyltransferase involved in cell wall biosynthesis